MQSAGLGSIARAEFAPNPGILAADFAAGQPTVLQRARRDRLARTGRHEPSMEQAAA